MYRLQATKLLTQTLRRLTNELIINSTHTSSVETVNIKQGRLRGNSQLNQDGVKFYSFKRIPYAKPPLGELRFKAPQPPEPWPGVLDATVESPQCYSHDMFTMKKSGSEDCLFLNVYTPSLPSESQRSLKPVMVWIHGGGFMFGSNDSKMYGPEFLLTQDVVLVAMNYRLGLFGFLSMEDESLGVPGNAGMKDVVMALKWVKENIASFSGDPGNVTVFGESAGAAAVHYLMCSPMAKGLFHKAIAHSGCALNNWARGERTAQNAAQVLNYNTSNEKEILKRLSDAPYTDILLAEDKILASLGPYAAMGIHKPLVEKPSNEPTFLSREPFDVIQAGDYSDVPTIYGYTKEEGMLPDINRLLAGKKPKPLTNFAQTIPPSLGISHQSKEGKELIQKIKAFYFGKEEPSLSNKQKEYDLLTDSIIYREVVQAIRAQIKTAKAPIYLYRFSLDTSLNLFKSVAKYNTKGTCHGDDLGYLFKNRLLPEVTPGSTEDTAVRRVVKLWSSFAASGNPNPVPKDPLIDVEWKPITKEAFHYCDIGSELVAGVNPEAARVAFWEGIFESYGKKL